MKSKRLTVGCALTAFVGMMFFLNWVFPWCSDDNNYGILWTGSEWVRLGSIWNAFKIGVMDPHRPFVHLITRIFTGCFDKWVFNVVNALVAGFLLVLINRFAHRTWRLDPCSLLVTIALFFFFLVEGESFFWMCGSCNYLWVGVLTLFFLIFRERLERDEVASSKVLLFIPVAAIVGEANESFSPPICIALAMWGLFHFKELNWKKVVIYSAYGISAALLCWHESSRATTIPRWTAFGAVAIAVKELCAVKCLWIAAILFLFLRNKRQFVRENAFELLVIGVDLVIDYAIGFVGERVLFITNMLSVVLVLRMREFGWKVAVFCGLAVCFWFVALIPTGVRIRLNFDNFLKMYLKSTDGVARYDYYPRKLFGRYFYQVNYPWQPCGYHATVFARAYGRGDLIPIALPSYLYDDVYLSDSFCREENQLSLEKLRAYAKEDGNAIVLPLPQEGVDAAANEVEVVYDFPGGIKNRLLRIFRKRQLSFAEYEWWPLRLKTTWGECLLVPIEPASRHFVRDIVFKRTNRPHPDFGKFYWKENVEK